MKKRWKRLLSIVTALVLCLGLLPSTALADETLSYSIDDETETLIISGTTDGSDLPTEGYKSIEITSTGEVTDGTYTVDVTNYGKITGGTFEKESYALENYGTISGGDFDEVLNRAPDGLIEGGEFDKVSNYGNMTGGTVEDLTNIDTTNNGCTVRGVTVTGSITNSNSVCYDMILLIDLEDVHNDFGSITYVNMTVDGETTSCPVGQKAASWLKSNVANVTWYKEEDGVQTELTDDDVFPCQKAVYVSNSATNSVTMIVNGVEVTRDNEDDVLGDGNVSYDADTNTLTINGALSGGTNISGNGTTDVVINGVDNSPAAFGLTVNGARNVTVTANSASPAIYGSSTGVGANITCSGDVEITNNGGGQAVVGTLTVNGARNVTVTANSYGAINGATEISCSGDVEITNNGGMAVGYTLIVHSAQDVKVTANSGSCAINNVADITCSGNVEIVNNGGGSASAVQGTLTVNRAQDVTVTAKSGQAVSRTLTVKDAQNVKVTANSDLAATVNYVSITCSGNVEIVNQGAGKAVGYTLTFQQSNGHSYIVKSGSSLETLEVYVEKEAGETFGPESFDAAAVKIESAGHTPGEWEHDSNQHWRFCTICGAELDRADHSGSTCTVCGYTKPSGGGSHGSGGSSTPTYPPTVEQADEGGSVTVSPKNPKKGDTVTITPKPEDGYEVDEIIVTDKDDKPVAIKKNADGTFAFTQPSGKVTIAVSFVEIQQPSVQPPVQQPSVNRFADVSADAYYYNGVLWAMDKGITSGISDTAFSPDTPCTRAQAVTFLWRAAGCPAPKNSVMPYEDIAKDSYYYDAVLWAVENGITKGTSDTTFSPDNICSRAQIMSFIYRSEQAQGGGMQGQWMFQNSFTDVNPEDYYGEAVMWAVANGITKGTSDTTFSPDADCTRAQIVTFLYHYMGK
ncbi:S-layer homology domain-containing protein [Anaerotignum sp.]